MHPAITLLGIQLPTMSLMLYAAIFICVLYYCISDRYSKLILWPLLLRLMGAAMCASVGGKVLALLVSGSELTGSIVHRVLYAGFVFYGGLLGGILGLWIVCAIGSRRKPLSYPFLYWTDFLATLLPLGQTIGRIGCFFNGCCYGRHWTGPLGVWYPIWTKGEIAEYARVFPTWFVESTFCLGLFFVLRRMWGTTHKYYHRGMRCGRITAVYLSAYAGFRFLLEFQRGDEVRGRLGWLSTSQIISICIGVALIIAWMMQRKNERGFRS